MAMTLEELGQKVKAKYPQYNNLSDVDVANKVIAKYPQYKDQVTPAAAPVAGGPPMGQQPQGWLGKTASAVGNFGVGFAKEAASIGHRAAEFGQLIGSESAKTPQGQMIGAPIRAVAKAVGLTPTAAQAAQQTATAGAQRPGYLTPTGTAQKVGAGAENVAEFFLPVGGEAKAVGQVGKITEKLPTIEKIAKVGVEALGAAAKNAIDFAARTGLQEATPEQIKGASELGALFGAGGKIGSEILKTIAPKAVESLTRSGLNLTVPQKRDLGEKVTNAVDYLVKNKITGTNTEKFEQMAVKYDDAEKVFQSFLKSPEAATRTVPKSEFVSKLENLKGAFQNDRDVLAIEKQIDDAIKTINEKQPEQIPIENLNIFKRSTYKGAFNNAGTKVSDAVEFNIGDIARSEIEKATQGLTVDGKSVADFNKEYGTIIDTKKILKLVKDRKDLGLVGRLLSHYLGSFLGGIFGGPLGSVVGTATGGAIGEKLGGASSRFMMGQAIDAASKAPKSVIPWTKAAIQSVTSLPRLVNKTPPVKK